MNAQPAWSPSAIAAATLGGVNKRSVYRGGGVCGLAAMGLLVASLPMAPPWPDAAASTEAVVGYFAANHAGFLRQAWVACLGVMLLVPFAAALEALCVEAARPVAGRTLFGATVVFAGTFGINWIPWVAIALRPGLSADAVRALYDFGLLGQFIGVGAPLAVLFGAVFFSARDGSVLPKWIAVLAAVQVPLNVVLAGCTSPSGVFAPSGPIGFASIGLFTVYGVGASIAMLRRGSAPERA